MKFLSGYLPVCLLVVSGLMLPPVFAFDMLNRYVPRVPMVSPMRDNVVYTPVGLGIVTSKAGFRIHPITGGGDFHNGVDLAAKLNDNVYNLLDGTVTRVGWRGHLGVAVEVLVKAVNVRVIVGHLNAYCVQPGQFVARGQVIGFAGTTGRSTGVHVHYTVIDGNNNYVDPMAFLMMIPKYRAVQRMCLMQAASARTAQTASSRRTADSAARKPISADEDDLPSESKETAPPDPTSL